jgi:chromosome segregation ATPase
MELETDAIEWIIRRYQETGLSYDDCINAKEQLDALLTAIQEQTAEIARMKSDYTALQRERTEWYNKHEKLREEISKLRAELDAAEERGYWLCSANGIYEIDECDPENFHIAYNSYAEAKEAQRTERKGE